MENTGKRIEEGLRLRNMKRSDLANRLGISRGSVTNYINGRYKPSGEMNDRIASVLGVSAAWLAGFSVPMIRDLGLDSKTLQSAQSEAELIQVAYISADEKIKKAIRVLLEIDL